MSDLSTLNHFPEVQSLPTQKKLQLAEELWLSVSRELQSIDVSADVKLKLEERWETYLRDPSQAITLEEFKRRIKADRQWYKSVSSRRLSKT
jgi:putative addiction module component (TIGR02574 family)